MITLQQLNRAVCDRYRQALAAAGVKAPLVEEDLSTPFFPPCAKVVLEDGADGLLLRSGRERSAAFRLYYFAADSLHPKLENLAVRSAVGTTFLDGLTVDGLYLVSEEGTAFATPDGVLTATLSFTWAEPVPESAAELMETLNLNVEVQS
ncbi:MAG: hypothetical protein RR295_04600 [Oscillospiraceae bacterium]